MKGFVYAKGEEELKPIRHTRQIFEYFKNHSDPRIPKSKLIFSIGEGDCHLVFTCRATVGRHYYFAMTFESRKGTDHSKFEDVFFWITHKHIWDQIQDISTEQPTVELIMALPDGFILVENGKYKYTGEWDEGVAMLKSHGFEWCDAMEEKLCNEHEG